NMLYFAQQRKLPIFMANARLSERSARGYRRFASLTRAMLRAITAMAVQTSVEAERFIALGMDPKRITVTGSVKYDLETPADIKQRAAILRQQWGIDRPIWIAASTHEGEEELILNAFIKVQQALPNTLLVLVPRHPERFDSVAALCQRRGLHIVR